ncbi:DUF3784 domain-containing protein [Algoriphagus halophytocola]|uniref:DUF3784 domain-containing protein n=1 Tax=Algoriphagus halophytocola TaxID=2991499 RepID=A0ABY6MGB4_9BACT|nr:DUF3784 domain-containing protein [Algoriphagus sp. TR-M5]UZD22228.1 DUF3784 domain-containing protein [Algoriphagus sp. TR-M5]
MEALIFGTLYLTIGILVRKFPNLLAGYNSLTQSDRENAKKNGLQFYASLLFSLMGILAFTGYPLSIWLDSPQLIVGIPIMVTIVGMILAIVGLNLLVNNKFR